MVTFYNCFKVKITISKNDGFAKSNESALHKSKLTDNFFFLGEQMTLICIWLTDKNW